LQTPWRKSGRFAFCVPEQSQVSPNADEFENDDDDDNHANDIEDVVVHDVGVVSKALTSLRSILRVSDYHALPFGNWSFALICGL
jgi:hypothetical protein